jgi:hypothetical protein
MLRPSPRIIRSTWHPSTGTQRGHNPENYGTPRVRINLHAAACRTRTGSLRTETDDEEMHDEASVAAIGRPAHIDSARKSKAVRRA